MTPDKGELYLRLVLPFRLPTHNALNAMGQWEKATLNRWTRNVLSQYIVEGFDSLTLTVRVLKVSLTQLCKLEYLSMIVPNSSKKYRIRKRKSSQAKRKKL